MASVKIKKNEISLCIVFVVLLLGLVVRFAYLQFVKGDELTQKAYYQQTKDMIVTAKRGTIYDSTGKILAQSATTDCISLDIAQIKEPEKIAKELSSLLDLDYEDLLKKATDKSVSTQIVKRRVETKYIEELRNWIEEEKITGITITEDSKRYYPYNNLASHVIGFTGTDNQGLSGIEMVYDSQLRGTPGRVFTNVDASQKEMTYTDEKYYNAQDGNDITLTIDYNIQSYLENHLETAIIDSKATNGGVAIAMNPKTGEILGFAVKPDFNLNEPFEPNTSTLKSIWSSLDTKSKTSYREQMWRNKALVDTYEPGSTFKIITAAIGIEEGIVSADDYYVCTPITIGTDTINCWDDPHGGESFKQAMQNSCNPVMVQVAQKIGKDKYYKYMKAFGIDSKTGIELPEVVGQMHDYSVFNEVELATVSFGMRFNATPISLITAYSAAINGGKLLQPSLIKQIADSNGNIISQFERKEIKSVVSEETSQKLREILESVVAEGTGKNAKVSGYRIGGKTGTADQIIDGTYDISFFGFAPANDPEIAILMILYNPTSVVRSGGATAAPVVGKMFKDILPYMNVEMSGDPTVETYDVEVPNVVGISLSEAYDKLKEVNLSYRTSGTNVNSNAIVLRQTPQAGSTIGNGSQIILFTEESTGNIKVKVPDLQGLTVDEANKKLTDLGLVMKVIGSGTTNSQSPSAGTEVELGTVVQLTCYNKE